MIENEKTLPAKNLYKPEERKVQEKFLMGFTLNTRFLQI